MSPEPEPNFSFVWRNDLRIRCEYHGQWVDFGFDLGGREKDLPLERNPAEMSDGVSDEFVARAREALVIYLRGIGYRVIDLSY